MTDFTHIAQIVVSGIGVGCIYGLIGIGFCVIYNASGIVNFAQGAFVMLGGMVTHVLLVRVGLPYPIAAILAILLVAVLHFVDDADDPGGLIARLHDAVAPGSLLIVSHASQDGQRELAATHQQLYARTATPMTMRSHEEIKALFEWFLGSTSDVMPPTKLQARTRHD